MPGVHTVYGHRSGTAVITIGGNVIAGHFSVTFNHYSDHGKHFLTGTQTIDGSVESATTITDNLAATDAGGRQIGDLRANLTFRQIVPAPPSGFITAHVTADSHRDIRPVQGATVKLFGNELTTDRRGSDVFRIPVSRLARDRATARLTAWAGNTFKPALAAVRLQGAGARR
jgi:hypothetical protein